MLAWISQNASHEAIRLIPITALLRTRAGLEYACSYILGNNMFSFWVLGQIFPLPPFSLVVLPLKRKGLVVPGFEL